MKKPEAQRKTRLAACSVVALCLAFFLSSVACRNEGALGYVERGATLVLAGQLDRALVAFTKATQIDSSCAKAWAGKGMVFAGLESHDSAVASLERAAGLDSAYRRAWVAAIVNKGLALLGLNRPDEALGTFEVAIELMPHHARAWYSKSMVLGAKQDYAPALEALDSALKYNPADTLAWKGRGLLLEKLGRPGEAAEAYAKLKDLRK